MGKPKLYTSDINTSPDPLYFFDEKFSGTTLLGYKHKNTSEYVSEYQSHLVSLQPGGPTDVATLVALLELAPPLLVVHQLVVPPLGRLVGEGHVAVAAEVLPDVPLHVVPVSVDLLHGDVGEELESVEQRRFKS